MNPFDLHYRVHVSSIIHLYAANLGRCLYFAFICCWRFLTVTQRVTVGFAISHTRTYHTSYDILVLGKTRIHAEKDMGFTGGIATAAIFGWHLQLAT